MKYEIEIPELPEGWRAVAWRRLKNGDHYLNDKGEIVRNEALIIFAMIVEKIKQRRIVLEETEHESKYGETQFIAVYESTHIRIISDKIWRVVKGR